MINFITIISSTMLVVDVIKAIYLGVKGIKIRWKLFQLFRTASKKNVDLSEAYTWLSIRNYEVTMIKLEYATVDYPGNPEVKQANQILGDYIKEKDNLLNANLSVAIDKKLKFLMHVLWAIIHYKFIRNENDFWSWIFYQVRDPQSSRFHNAHLINFLLLDALSRKDHRAMKLVYQSRHEFSKLDIPEKIWSEIRKYLKGQLTS